MTTADDLLRRVLRHFNKTDYTLALQEDIEKYLSTKDNPDCKSVQKRLAIQEKAEPVAWTNEEQLGYLKDPKYSIHPTAMWSKQLGDNVNVPLYLHPPRPMKPMTEEEIEDNYDDAGFHDFDMVGRYVIELVRAVERHHGIGGSDE